MAETETCRGGYRDGEDVIVSDNVANKLEDRLYQFIQDNFPSARQKDITPATKLLDEGVVDSLGLLLLVEYLEDEFDITTDDDELQVENFGSIESLTRFIEKKSAG